MPQNIFETRPLLGTSYFQKLFRQFPEENAVIELNNLLALNPITAITTAEINTIENKYKLNLLKEFKLNLEEFYAVYLNHCLADKTLSSEEINQLNHLKHILNLDEKTIEKLHIKIGEIIYKKSFQDALSDGRLEKEEEDFLSKLESTLQLPKELANKISAETRTAFINKHVARIIADHRLSPAEQEELNAIAASLNVTVQLDDKTKRQLEKLKLYWALENLDLPVTEPDINIQKSELCHLMISNVNWYELRSSRSRVEYGGYSNNFKIAKGFYLKSGNYHSKSYSTSVMKLIDTGTVYLTNKRIIFTGTLKNSNIRIDKILNITPYEDGLEIGKETGKSPTLQLGNNADVFCIMLERILAER